MHRRDVYASTCVSINLSNGSASSGSDPYWIISSGGISFGNGFITIPLRTHVTQTAANGCVVATLTQRVSRHS